MPHEITVEAHNDMHSFGIYCSCGAELAAEVATTTLQQLIDVAREHTDLRPVLTFREHTEAFAPRM